MHNGIHIRNVSMFSNMVLCFVACFSVNLYSKLIFLFFCALEINHLKNNLKIFLLNSL